MFVFFLVFLEIDLNVFLLPTLFLITAIHQNIQKPRFSATPFVESFDYRLQMDFEQNKTKIRQFIF